MHIVHRPPSTTAARDGGVTNDGVSHGSEVASNAHDDCEASASGAACSWTSDALSSRNLSSSVATAASRSPTRPSSSTTTAPHPSLQLRISIAGDAPTDVVRTTTLAEIEAQSGEESPLRNRQDAVQEDRFAGSSRHTSVTMSNVNLFVEATTTDTNEGEEGGRSPTNVARQDFPHQLSDFAPEGKEHRFHCPPVGPSDPHQETVSHLLSQLERWREAPSPTSAPDSLLAETLQALGDWCGSLPDWSEACQALLKDHVPSRTVKVMELVMASMEQLQPLDLPPKGALAPASSCHFHDHDSLLQACYVLANLCYRAGRDAQSKIGDLGGVEALVRALRVRPRDDLLQQFACGALGNLIRMDHGANARRLVEAGGVEAVVWAMEQHPHALELQEWAFRALHNVCHWSDFRARVVDAGGITAIEAARRNHAMKDEGPEEGQPERQDQFFRQTEWAMAVLTETVQSSPQ